MALEFAHGAVQWLSASGVSTVYTISGLAFQPKALRFYSVGISSATDATSTVADSQRNVGFAVSTSSRRCATSSSDVSAGSAACATVVSDDCVVGEIGSSGSRAGLLDLNSITSDGFTLIVDAVVSGDITVFWEAWGGGDITVATVGDITEPAATGNVDYTVTGFVSGATDQVVMFAGVQSVAALNTGDANDSGFHVGFASSGAAADNVTICGNSDDGSATMETDGYCQDGECVSMIVIGGGATVNARATLTQFGTDNFRLNWAARATTGRRSIFLAIKGGNWKAGSYTISGTGTTATVSGLPFAPIGLSLVGTLNAEGTPGSTAANDRIGLGTGTSPTSRRSMAMLDEDAVATSEIDTSIQYTQVLTFASAVGTQAAAFDIDAMNSDGFRIIADLSAGDNWQGYLTFGNSVRIAPSIQQSSAAWIGHTVS